MEVIEIWVNFSVAHEETQNFVVPVYSGSFAFKAVFKKKNSSAEAEVTLAPID